MQIRFIFVMSLSLAVLMAPAGFSQGYPSVSQVEMQLQSVAAAFPSICEFVDLTARYGTPPTWNGHHIFAVRISDNPTVDEDEPSLLMVSAHHGNEIGTPVIALDAIDRLTQGYGIDPQVTPLVDAYEIWIIPVCNPDGYEIGTRRNANPNGTVDLNRNYPFLWGSPCNTGIKGPFAGSEPETQTIMALSLDQSFTKVQDYHSSGRETLYGYRQACQNHQLVNYLQDEAIALSCACGYGGDNRGPSSNGEHYHWQLGQFSNYAFLTETHSTQSPSYSSAVAEAATVWPGTLWMMERPIPVWGRVTEAATGAPLQAQISYLENPFTLGEQNNSEHRFGRYHAFLPAGNHTIRFECPGYVSQDHMVTVVSGASIQLDVGMVPGGDFAMQLSTTGGGVCDLHLALLNVPPTTTQGYTVFSFDTSMAVGAGPVFGLAPDAFTLQGLSTPAAPGNIFHWQPFVPGLFPEVAFDLPPGTLSAFAGLSGDGRGLALDAFWTPTFTDVIRITF